MLNIIQRRYGHLRRQQLLADVLQATELYIVDGYTVEEIPGVLGRIVLDWDEMCRTRGADQDAV